MGGRTRLMKPMRTPIDQIGRRASDSQTNIQSIYPLISTIQFIKEHSPKEINTKTEQNHEKRKIQEENEERKIKEEKIKEEKIKEEKIKEEKIQQEVYEIIYFRPKSDWAYDDDLRIGREVEQIMSDLENGIFKRKQIPADRP